MGPRAFDAAGSQAAPVATLSWAMTIGALLLTLMVIVFVALAIKGPARWKARLGSERAVILGGIALPVVVLTALLVWGLRLTSVLVWPEAEDRLRIRVTGYQWWWQVAYLDGPRTISANEIVIPTGRKVELDLRSTDVIHSFWVPRLSGKLDMVPGHSNKLLIEAETPGIYRGQCAEYCGGAHALMALRVVALAPDDYARWQRREAAPAIAPANALAMQGQQLFLTRPCAVCHSIRGTTASAQVAPDLTHVGSRHTLAAGVLPNNRGTLAAWIANAQHIKPGNKMPSFALPPDELNALAAYLSELK